MNISNPSPPSSTYLTDKLEQLKLEYPAYYRVWKSMITSYGAQEVCTDWRGTLGLICFIEDSSTLANSPTNLPDFAHTVKLKRLETSALFSLNNIMWALTKASERVVKLRSVRAYQKLRYGQHPSVLPSVLTPITGITVESIKQSYPSISSMETRLDTLFTESMTRTLSSIELAELDMLGKLVVSPDGTLPTPVPKCEDI